MKKLTFLMLSVLLLSSCGSPERIKTSKMELEARSSIEAYLVKNKLPIKELKPFKSSAHPRPDFSYLYTGGGRCIEFIINCNQQSCTELSKYPYDEHGEECP